MTPLVALRAITKRFGPVRVLTDVDLDLHAGRVHSLAGENGAGKSTLVKILGGIHQPDSGRILIDGAEVALRGAADAQRHGIAVIHQHPTVFPDLSVAENVFIGRQPIQRGRIDWVAMRAEARELLARLDMPIDVHTPVKMLGIAERQTIEIVRALSLDARVLIMDEPTSAISSSEVDRLFEIVLRLKRQGVAILFISHFIDEILRMGDDVTILRSGRRIITCPGAELTPEQTVRHMVGTDLAAFFPKEAAVIGDPVASVRGLSGAGFVEDVTFDLRAGEILGFFGLVGAGRSEVAQMLFGITRPTSGEIQAYSGEELVNVFVPTTPNPTSGFLLFVPRSDLIHLDMSVEDGIKMVISGGIVGPAAEEQGEEREVLARAKVFDRARSLEQPEQDAHSAPARVMESGVEP